MTSGSQALPTAKPQGFRWFSGGDAAMGHLCSESLKEYLSKPIKGVKDGDKVDREIATQKLLYCLAAVGPKGPSVAISLKVGPTELPRYPRGHRKALAALIADGWVVCDTLANRTGSWHKYQASEGKMSAPTNKPMVATAGTYRLSAKAWRLLDEKGFNASSLMPDAERCVIVKTRGQSDPDGNGCIDEDDEKVILPPHHPQLSKWIEQLRDHSAIIRRFHLTLHGVPIPATEFDLRRIFNGADYRGGGRFYSNFVQMPGIERSRVLVDNQPLASLDYRALYPRLSLALIGMASPLGDLYEIEGHNRDHVKLIWTSAIGANNKSGASRKANQRVKSEGGDGKAILEAVKAKYPGIEAVLGRGLSLPFQRAEARALEVFLGGFNEQGRPLLPVHDGYYFLDADRSLFESLRPLAEAALFAELNEQIQLGLWGSLEGFDTVKMSETMTTLPMA
jgi:hypothetical protein